MRYFEQHSVHGDVWPDGQSYCARCDVAGTDNDHECFTTPNGIDRYRHDKARNLDDRVVEPDGLQNVISISSDRSLEEDDRHWVWWASQSVAAVPPRAVEAKWKARFERAHARDVHRYIRDNARYKVNRRAIGLRRLPTLAVVTRILAEGRLQPALWSLRRAGRLRSDAASGAIGFVWGRIEYIETMLDEPLVIGALLQLLRVAADDLTVTAYQINGGWSTEGDTGWCGQWAETEGGTIAESLTWWAWVVSRGF